MIELNSKKKEEVSMSSEKDTIIEISELSYDDIARLVCHAFNHTMNDEFWYQMFGLYPTSSRVVMVNMSTEIPHYYITNYSIQNNTITLGEITEVEPDWKPIGNEKGVEFNSEIVNKKLKENSKMDETKVLEMNQKLTENATIITDLTAKNVEINSKLTEVNATIVAANKTVEEINAKIAILETELNTVKTERDALQSEKATAETETKKAEINSYMTTEIPKNGFTTEEVNSLNVFVDEINMVGLKSAESELCAKKFKEIISKKEKDVEVNSTETNFIPIREKAKKTIADETTTFFKEI